MCDRSVFQNPGMPGSCKYYKMLGQRGGLCDMVGYPGLKSGESILRWSSAYAVMHMPVKTGALRDSQKVKITQVSIGRWMVKQNAVYQNNGYYSAIKGKKF